jgi:hypothetical protein
MSEEALDSVALRPARQGLGSCGAATWMQLRLLQLEGDSHNSNMDPPRFVSRRPQQRGIFGMSAFHLNANIAAVIEFSGRL